MYEINQIAHRNGNLENKDVICAIEQFEKEIRKDQMNKSARAVKFSAERFKLKGDYVITISDAETVIKEE